MAESTTTTTETTEKPKEGESALSKDDLAALKGSIETLSGGVKEILTRAQQIEEQRRAAATTATTEPDEEGELPDDATLETLPRSQFAQHLLKAFQRNLTDALKPVQESITRAQTTATTTDLRTQVESFAAKHPDFGDWKDEMLAIAKENPTLPVNRLYALARAENPTKLVEVEKKYKTSEKETEDGKGGKTERNRAAKGNGLSPSGSVGEHKPGKMTAQQAAESAWEETVSRFGGDPWK